MNGYGGRSRSRGGGRGGGTGFSGPKPPDMPPPGMAPLMMGGPPGMMGGGNPAQISALIQQCTTPQQLLQVVDQFGVMFDESLLGVSIYQLGVLHAASPEKDSAYLADTPQVMELAMSAVRLAPALGPKQIAEVLHGLASLGFVGGPPLWGGLAMQCLDKLPGFSATQLASSMWALAKIVQAGYAEHAPQHVSGMVAM